MRSRSTDFARRCARRAEHPSRGRDGELSARDHPRRRGGLRRRDLRRLLHPDLHPDPALLGPAHAVLPLAARNGRLHPSGRRPVSEPLSACDPAARERRIRHRHQPDPGDHHSQHRRTDRRIADRRLRERAVALLVPGLVACGVVVAVDQGTKALVTALIDPGDRVEVLPFLAFENVRNKGVAFGLGGDISAALIGVTILFLVGLLVFLAVRGGSGWLVWLPGALLLGGALGNLADRVREGAVIDFIDLPLWPTFNLADVAITAGVLLLLLDVERGDGRRKDP